MDQLRLPNHQRPVISNHISKAESNMKGLQNGPTRELFR